MLAWPTGGHGTRHAAQRDWTTFSPIVVPAWLYRVEGRSRISTYKEVLYGTWNIRKKRNAQK